MPRTGLGARGTVVTLGTLPAFTELTVWWDPQTQVLMGARQQGERCETHQQAQALPLLIFADPGEVNKWKSICHVSKYLPMIN